jgi:hypothetical protein
LYPDLRGIASPAATDRPTKKKPPAIGRGLVLDAVIEID